MPPYKSLTEMSLATIFFGFVWQSNSHKNRASRNQNSIGFDFFEIINTYPWQLHAALSVYPKFWGHWAFIYSRYCSYSSLILTDVLPTTRHVSEERKLFDVGEIFFFCLQRKNKTCLIDFKFIECVTTAGATIPVNFKLEPDIFIDERGFYQLPPNDRTHWPIFTLKRKMAARIAFEWTISWRP